ncbi:MAG: Na+/H+ antiporter NhaA [Planctomycetaceae bacterium]|nr:Na+/H+ antiporter NhaA [Planctomycetaceae bacterium]
MLPLGFHGESDVTLHGESASEHSKDASPAANLPRRPVERLLTPVRRFLHVESASGIFLLVCTVTALVLANSPLAGWFSSIWKTKVELSIGTFRLAGDLGHLVINDGLMTIFFFVVGLEIKREIVSGELRELRKALLPVFAALGGMIAPALIYLALQWGEPGQRGWAIPMATDIAFVVGFLALFGPRVPFSLKILLLTLAIVDDLGAVLIIAIVFTSSLAWEALAVAALGFALTYGLNRIGVRRVGVYMLVGMVIWAAMYKSGIHPTMAGVLLGLLTPATAWVGDKTFFSVMSELWERLRGYEPKDDRRYAVLDELQFAARESVSPLHRLELALHPWVAFLIMPLFALANAGVPLEVSGLRDPVALSVAAGLAIGKPVGILLFCWLAVRLGLSKLPHGVSWSLLVGGACLAGIGFTMSLFINGLAFPVAEFPQREAAGKVGTLLGSAISVILGASILLFVLRRRGAKHARG